MRHTYAHAVLDKNPVAYYRLAETTGPKVHDKTGNGHTGVVGGSGSPSFSERPPIASDPEDTAIAFDGQSYIQIPSDPVFSQPTSGNGLTVEAWFRPDSLDFVGEAPDRPYIYWLGKGGPGQYEWALRFYNSASSDRPNRISAYLFNPVGIDGKPDLGAGAYTEEPLTEGEWIHIVACYDPGDYTVPGARVSIYHNGVQSQASSGQLYNNPGHWQISPVAGPSPLLIASRDTASFFTGAIDEVAIYPRVLSAAEVMDNYSKAL